MTSSPLIERLAERCEQATGPDRELACSIAKAIGFDGGPLGSKTSSPWAWCPDYTASLDAATTLVPEGAIWEVGHKVNYPAAAGEPNRANYAFVNVGLPGAVKSFDGKSIVAPALALCAAALRAKATSND